MELHIVVCVKQVPISNNLKIDPITKNLIRGSELGVMNPFDKNAIEAALVLKEQYGAKVTLLSMGPSNFDITLRQGLAMGCDEAVLLSSRAFGGADTLATGYVLSMAIKKLGDVSLAFFGRQSVDADTGQVGPIVAEFLDWPQATYISEIKPIDKTKINATRLMENLEQSIIVEIPAVLTVRSELNEPRYPSPRNIQLSYKKEIIIWNEDDISADPNRIGVKGSPTIVRDVWTPAKNAKVSVCLGLTAREAVNNLLVTLRAKDIL